MAFGTSFADSFMQAYGMGKGLKMQEDRLEYQQKRDLVEDRYRNSRLSQQGELHDAKMAELDYTRDKRRMSEAANMWYGLMYDPETGERKTPEKVSKAGLTRFANTFPQFTTFAGQNPRVDDQEPFSGFTMLPGTDTPVIAAELKMRDGSIAPLTNNRSSDPEDAVLTLPWQDFGDTVETELSKFGFQNPYAESKRTNQAALNLYEQKKQIDQKYAKLEKTQWQGNYLKDVRGLLSDRSMDEMGEEKTVANPEREARFVRFAEPLKDIIPDPIAAAAVFRELETASPQDIAVIINRYGDGNSALQGAVFSALPQDKREALKAYYQQEHGQGKEEPKGKEEVGKGVKEPEKEPKQEGKGIQKKAEPSLLEKFGKWFRGDEEQELVTGAAKKPYTSNLPEPTGLNEMKDDLATYWDKVKTPGFATRDEEYGRGL